MITGSAAASLPVSVFEGSGGRMFKINDVIVYGKSGICRVEKIGPIALPMADKNRMYYTLRPVYESQAVIYAPVDNEKTVMRLTMSKEEADQLIEEIPDLKTAWIGNEKDREARYRSALSACDCRELIRMIKGLYQKRALRVRDGKKVTVVDERYFKLAQTQLYSELAYALGIDKAQVTSYIEEKLQVAE